MQTTFTVRRWAEELCRKGQDSVFIEYDLDEPFEATVIYREVADGEGGYVPELDEVLPLVDVKLGGGEGRFQFYPKGVCILDYLPASQIEVIRESIEIETEPDWKAALEWELFA